MQVYTGGGEGMIFTLTLAFTIIITIFFIIIIITYMVDDDRR